VFVELAHAPDDEDAAGSRSYLHRLAVRRVQLLGVRGGRRAAHRRAGRTRCHRRVRTVRTSRPRPPVSVTWRQVALPSRVRLFYADDDAARPRPCVTQPSDTSDDVGRGTWSGHGQGRGLFAAPPVRSPTNSARACPADLGRVRDAPPAWRLGGAPRHGTSRRCLPPPETPLLCRQPADAGSDGVQAHHATDGAVVVRFRAQLPVPVEFSQPPPAPDHSRSPRAHG
jgi:hypothetical protein